MSRRSMVVVRDGLSHVLAHPLRSALTAATCAVAIAVTVNVISLNYGLDEDIRGDVRRFGRLTLDVGRSPMIRPGEPRATFGDEDLARVTKAVEGLATAVVPMRQRMTAVRGDAVEERVSVVAAPPDYVKTLDIGLVAGRWLVPADSGFSACVLDKSAASGLFPGVSLAGVIGRRVAIGSDSEREAPVVGILDDPMTYRALFEAFDENRKSRTLTGALLSFRNVYVPFDALETADLSRVSVVARDEASLGKAADRLGALYPRATPDDRAAFAAPITVFVRRDWMNAIGGSTQTGAFLGNLVWMLIVLVACVMISTLNLITIRERYDELAVRRCEGARRRDLVLQVTAEGALVSVVGGLLGLPLGYAGAALLRRLVAIPFRFESRYAFVAMGVSLVLGLLSSVVPARRAAGLDPAAVLSRRLS